jgi:flagellin
MDALITEIDRIAGTTTWAGEQLMDSESQDDMSFSFQVGAATGDKNQIKVDIKSMAANKLGFSTFEPGGGEAAPATLSDITFSQTGYVPESGPTEATPAEPVLDQWVADLLQGEPMTAEGIVQLNNGLTQATMIISEKSPGTPPNPKEVEIDLSSAAAINQSVADINTALTNAGYTVSGDMKAEVGALGDPNGDADDGLLVMTGPVSGITFAPDETNSTANATVDGSTGRVTFAIHPNVANGDGTVTHDVWMPAVLSFESGDDDSIQTISLDPNALHAAPDAINGNMGVHGLVAEIISEDDGNGGVVGVLHLRTAVVAGDGTGDLSSPASNAYDLSSVTSDRNPHVRLEDNGDAPFVAAGSRVAATYNDDYVPAVPGTPDASISAEGLLTLVEGKTDLTISLGDADVDITGLTGDGSKADADIITAAINGSTDTHKFTAIANNDRTLTIVAGEQPRAEANRTSVAERLDALDTIEVIDVAIREVNIQRSKLGAVSNRLSHTINNLTNISSNLSAAQGGIEDADFAKETTDLAKNQILQQASTAMLAQANASKQNVLSLLQG